MDKTGRAPGSPMEPELQEFHTGAAVHAYRTFGCHALPGAAGHRFAVWAPHAQRVALVGDFNGWDAAATPMDRLPDGTWVQTVDGLRDGALYKYAVTGPDGQTVLKADPFAAHCETGPATASKVWALEGYVWHDRSYLRRRAARDVYRAPMSIYEVHLGSWRRPETGLPWYRSVAAELADYCRTMHYTHVELLPVTEYPYEGSWGYQVTGYYAPTSRYGTPQDFMYFVDTLHRAGIGVLMDWVPAHFPKDAHGLARFDGTRLYECKDARMAEHPEWGTLIFDYEMPEVQSFLISSAMSFFDRYHIDGIRVDAVSSMLYLNYARRDGEWTPNRDGGNINLGAVAFLQKLNTTVLTAWPGCVTVAEESSAYPGVTKPPYDGGLGFSFKWDMGFMHDTLDYLELDPYFRKYHHDKLTFSMMYAFSENFILAFSHDEVVHGKCSLIGRMPGDWWRQFAGLRTLAFYQMTHPGAKLNFMGNEIGQFIEWRYYESIQWFLTEEYETHRHHQAFIKALNHLYTAEPALYERGYTDDGFTWIDADNSKQSIVSFVRQGEDVDDDLVILINFDPASYESFRVGVPREGDWEVIFDSDRPEFGGSGYAGEEPYTCSSEPYPWNGQMDSIEMKVPGLAGVVLKRRGPSSYKPTVVEEPKKATRKRTSSVKPKAAAAKKAPVKAKTAKPAAKATAKPKAKKATNKKAAPKAKAGAVKASGKDA